MTFSLMAFLGEYVAWFVGFSIFMLALGLVMTLICAMVGNPDGFMLWLGLSIFFGFFMMYLVWWV